MSTSAKTAKEDVKSPLRHRRKLYIRPAIERLAKIIEMRNDDELKSFLSTEKGFKSDQYNPDDMFSLLHYVAEREFDSAEEADDWLTYAIVQKNQDIEMKSRNELRPLHRACGWGNIFGVEWLVTHGANINVEDGNGRTPYSLACASSVDTMKKMVYLEEHGYILSPSDIVWGACIRFSSSEKANEIFHYLVNEKGLSVNAIQEKYGYTPLHRACLNGSIFGMKWLVEHKADINSVDKYGRTPFMLACESSINRSAKVRYLDEKGADCRAKNHRGMTALFHATYDSSECEDDEVKDVLRYLVIEKGIDINSVDKEGRTPLLHACEYCLSCLVIQQLIELGADVSAKDEKRQNVLHIAAQNYKMTRSVIDLLIEKGVDVTCGDEEGNTPHQLAVDGDIRALLRQHCDAARFSVLQRKMFRPSSIKGCVIGDEMAGKTTFVNSLFELDRPPPKVENRTPGIEILPVVVSRAVKGTAWDFGGQPTFHSAHGLFFRPSNTVFALVLRFRNGQEMTPEIALLKIGRYWCAFVKAALRTLFSHQKRRLRLFIIFNLIDFEEEEGTEVSFLPKRVAEILQEEFRDTFEILHVIEMDCSKRGSVRIRDCQEKLYKIYRKMLEEADDVPKLCHDIERTLAVSDEDQKLPSRIFLTPKEFEKWVVEDVGITLDENEKKVSVEYLDSSGLIVNVGSQICPRPQWLCQNVVGPLLAPPNFLFGMPSEKCGEVSLTDIESALKKFEDDLKRRGTPSSYTVTAEEAVRVLLHLDLCIEVENSPGKFQIPALLQHSIRHDAWVEDAMFDVYRGQRYECSQCIDIISPSSFVAFQSRCSRMAKPTRREAWKDGVKLIRLVDDKVVESRIELGIKKGHCCIDIVLRWSSKKACDKVAKDFLVEIRDTVARACDERSPGVILNWFYLDSKQLKELDEDPAIYSMADVEMKVKEKAFDHLLFSIRPEKGRENGRYSSVRDLCILTEEEYGDSHREKILPRCSRDEDISLRNTGPRAELVAAPSSLSTFPADEEPVSVNLIRACAKVRGSKWEEIGALLIDLEDLEEIRKLYGGNFVRMVKVLEAWKLAKSPTVGQLLACFEEVGVDRHNIQTKYEELCRTVFK